MKKLFSFLLFFTCCSIVSAERLSLYDSILRDNTVSELPTDFNIFECTDRSEEGYNASCTVIDPTDSRGFSYIEEVYSNLDGLYPYEDDKGQIYFFRGLPNNWVQFGEYNDTYYFYFVDDIDNFKVGNESSCKSEASDPEIYCVDMYKIANKGDKMYWNIIRTNGDGSVRLLYSGTSPNRYRDKANIGASAFNVKNDDIKYTGYTYKENGVEVDSSLKTYLENWYSLTLEKEYQKYLVKGTFVNDTAHTYQYCYGSYYDDYCFDGYTRLYYDTEINGFTVSPSLKKSNSNIGFGGDYELYVGTFSGDEKIMSGGQMWGYIDLSYFNQGDISPDFSNYDDIIDKGYYARLSLTPIDFRYNNEYYSNIEMFIGDDCDYSENGDYYYFVAPVINVGKDVLFTGNGSKENPYVLSNVIEKEVSLKVADNNKLKITDYFEDLKGLEENVEWHSTNENVATINDGRIILKAVGDTIISTNYNNNDYVLKVKVSEDDLINPNTKDYIFILLILLFTFGAGLFITTKIKNS